MSAFGFVSLFIVVISVTVIILHYRLMRKRAPVDVHYDQLEELLRQWIENLYYESPVDSEIYNLCIQYIDLERDEILSAFPLIIEKAPPCEDTNAIAITETISTLNRAIEEYNTFIAKSPATVLMALVLGLKAVEPVAHVFESDDESELPNPSEEDILDASVEEQG